MSSEPRAQRTLVKSPPELWAEVSDEASLAKHFEAFGEIRITRLEPETTVAWEGSRASGTVELEPSGWGTRVTLSASAVELEPVAEPPEFVPVPEPVVVAEPVVEPEPQLKGQPLQPPPAPKRGFFARMFGKKAADPVVVPEPEPEPRPAPVAIVPQPEPVVVPEPVDAEAVLVSVLDDLGAAHHRPFSRG